METRLDDFETEPVQRPTFLTVLCILTFIGSGWAILSSAWSFTTASKFSKSFNELKRVERDSVMQKDSIHLNDTINKNERRRNREFGINIKATFSQMLTEDNIRKNAIGGFLAALFTLSGALLMWWLRRAGFYLYIIGVVFGGLIPFYLYGNNFLAVGVSSFGSFFGLIFIALYAMNLKSMRRPVTQIQ